jgi:hypothetical protein
MGYTIRVLQSIRQIKQVKWTVGLKVCEIPMDEMKPIQP